MSEDLYSKWLGLPPGRRPPDYYALLGLPRFCSDRHEIDAASSRQLGKLDAYAIHPDKDKREICHRMMNEVATARVLLIDDRRRAEYDQQLAQQASETTAAMNRSDDVDLTLQMPAVGEEPAPQGAPAAGDAHRLLRDMGTAEEAAAEEDDPIARTMAELKGQPVLDDRASSTMTTSQPRQVPWMLIGGAVMFLLAGAVATGLLISGRSEPEPAPEPAPAAPTPDPEPPGRGGAVFFDNFERSEPGLEYRLINSPPEALRIEQGKLVLSSPSAGTVRVDLVPQNRKPFQEVGARIVLQPGCRMIFGITNAARMTLTREGNLVSILVTPGYPGTDPNKKVDWPKIDISTTPDGTVPVRLFRRRDHVVWAIGDELVASSPEMRALGDPGITLESSGPSGTHASVDDLRIWFAK